MYDADSSTVINALNTANPYIFSDNTINQILNLATKDGNETVRINTVAPDTNGNVSVPAGAEVVFVATPDTTQTTLKTSSNAPVVIFQGKGGVNATINDTTTQNTPHTGTDRVVVGSAGNDRITIADAKNTQIILGTGDSTVVGGLGQDTVVVGSGNATVVGGTGHTVVKLAGNASNYNVSVNDGHVTLSNQTSNKNVDLRGIQYVQLDDNKALVFAKNSVEAAVTHLYQTAFGRTADAGGLNYWFDAVKGGATIKQVATAFTQSAEFTELAAASNEVFIQAMYRNVFNRTGEESGVAYWMDQLAHGSTRADLLASFSSIAAQVTNNTFNNTTNIDVQVVGNVQIVHNII